MTLIKTSQGIVNCAAIILAQLREPSGKMGAALRAPELLSLEARLVLELSLTGGTQLQLKGEEALRFYRILEAQSEDASDHRSLIPSAFRAI